MAFPLGSAVYSYVDWLLVRETTDWPKGRPMGVMLSVCIKIGAVKLCGFMNPDDALKSSL